MTDTFLVIIILGANLWMAWRAFRGLRIAFGTKSRVPKDVSELGNPLPLAISLKAHDLAELGFRKLGEAQLDIPTRPSPETVWVFISSDGTVIAEIAHYLVGFNTYYGDSRLEITYHPTGDRIKSDGLVMDFVETSVQAAYEAHCRRLQAIPQEFGVPTQLISMDDYIRLDIIWRRKLGSRTLRRFIALDIATIGAALYSLAVVSFAALFSDWLEYLALGIFPSLQPLLIRLLPAVLIMGIRMISGTQIAERIRRASQQAAEADAEERTFPS